MELTKALAGRMHGLAFAFIIVILSACHSVDESVVPLNLVGVWCLGVQDLFNSVEVGNVPTPRLL